MGLIRSNSLIGLRTTINPLLTLRFRATLWRLKDNVRCSSWAYWKAHSGLPIPILLQRGHFDPKFHVEGVALAPIIFAWSVRPYNFAADSFHTKKLCSRLSSSEVRFFYGNRPSSVFETPLGGLRGNVGSYDDHLRLIGKRVVDFLLALIELFSQVLRLRRYERLSVQNRRFCSRGPVNPKF